MYGLCERLGYTPDQVRAMRQYDVDELTRYITWLDGVRRAGNG